MKSVYKTGICSECKKECDILEVPPPERLIVNKSKNLCFYHNKTKSQKPKKIQKKTIKKYVRKATGEGDLFKEIWDALEPEQRVSYVTGFPLPTPHEMRVYYFSHILSKGSTPEFRLLKKNIVLMTLKEHNLWETGRHKIKADPKLFALWKHVFDLQDELKAQVKKPKITKMNRQKKYVDRLYKEWMQHGKIVLSVDYDSTIFPYQTIDNHDDIERTIELVKIAHQTGAYIVIFTASDPERHTEIMDYCQKVGIHVDSINKNPIDLPFGNSGKIYYNLNLCDRSGLNQALDILEEAMYMVRGNQHSPSDIG